MGKMSSKTLKKNKNMSSFLKNFIPFAILVVGSFVGLTEFRKLNYKYRKGENLNVFQETRPEAQLSSHLPAPSLLQQLLQP
jgi:hypothetical protein